MCIREVGLEDVVWIHLARDMGLCLALVYPLMNLQVYKEHYSLCPYPYTVR
jgi:hypothetical protein